MLARRLPKKFCMNCLYFQEANHDYTLIKLQEFQSENFQASMKPFGQCILFEQHAVKCRLYENLCGMNAKMYKDRNLTE